MLDEVQIVVLYKFREQVLREATSTTSFFISYSSAPLPPLGDFFFFYINNSIGKRRNTVLRKENLKNRLLWFI